jgi:hypothetical protein
MMCLREDVNPLHQEPDFDNSDLDSAGRQSQFGSVCSTKAPIASFSISRAAVAGASPKPSMSLSARERERSLDKDRDLWVDDTDDCIERGTTTAHDNATAQSTKTRMKEKESDRDEINEIIYEIYSLSSGISGVPQSTQTTSSPSLTSMSPSSFNLRDLLERASGQDLQSFRERNDRVREQVQSAEKEKEKERLTTLVGSRPWNGKFWN